MSDRRDRSRGGADHRTERRSALIDELDQSDQVSAIRRNAGLGSMAACGPKPGGDRGSCRLPSSRSLPR